MSECQGSGPSDPIHYHGSEVLPVTGCRLESPVPATPGHLSLRCLLLARPARGAEITNCHCGGTSPGERCGASCHFRLGARLGGRGGRSEGMCCRRAEIASVSHVTSRVGEGCWRTGRFPSARLKGTQGQIEKSDGAQEWWQDGNLPGTYRQCFLGSR
ncbi:hypothetical protein AAFF_G00423000 [Aldrovandia affinis]|uniref:Uncharacterized protein n=1 Tax=Aldrovandia affinis TaxID=143900 RepID=A0AAD7X015_9TELE|nr:hypothetical protein AAFF_G00423000 [Aldrovandia affinis]